MLRTRLCVWVQFYKKWMEQGIHVVTPNKRLNSGPLHEYLKVKQLQVGWSWDGGGWGRV